MSAKREVLMKLSEYMDKVNHCIANQYKNKEMMLNEENTIFQFILPLMEILEWDHSSGDVNCQHPGESGRADITLKTEGAPRAIIEAKRFNLDLTVQHMKQAMEYKIPARWVIITNGREIRVYDKRHRQKWGKLFFKLSLDRFKEEDLDILWLLSRYKIYKLNTVADEFLKYEKLIRKETRSMKNDVVKDFLSSVLKAEDAKHRLILLALKNLERQKIKTNISP